MHVYGSAVSGFGENADVDVTVLVPGTEAVLVLEILEDALPRLLPYFEVRERVYTARVPILRLRGNDVDFDLSVNNYVCSNSKLEKRFHRSHGFSIGFQRCKTVFISFNLSNLQSCRSCQELSNEHLLAQIGVDTAENGPLKLCQNLAKS